MCHVMRRLEAISNILPKCIGSFLEFTWLPLDYSKGLCAAAVFNLPVLIFASVFVSFGSSAQDQEFFWLELQR